MLPQDFNRTFDALADPKFFRKQEGDAMFDDEHQAALAMCLSRWSRSTQGRATLDVFADIGKRTETHFGSGRFKLSLPMSSDLAQTSVDSKNSPESYWTNPLSFAVIPEQSPELTTELQKADLVIFKGDLNYRKLTRCVHDLGITGTKILTLHLQ